MYNNLYGTLNMESGVFSPQVPEPNESPQPSTHPAPSTTSDTNQETKLNLSPEAWAANFQQCLELLRGPTDERRFVGLLLATKLLPDGGDAAIRQVLEALGWPFLARLLVPLESPSQQVAVSAELREQHVMGAGLALSILAAVCRLPDVAGSEEVVSWARLLARVVSAGGVSPLVVSRSSPSGPSQAGSTDAEQQAAQASADAEAVGEALECLMASCSYGGLRSCRAVATAGGLGAAAAVLARFLVSLPRIHKQQQQQQQQQGGSAMLRTPVMAVRLLGMLLSVPKQERDALLSDHVREVQGLVPALSHILGSESLLALQQASNQGTGSSQNPTAMSRGSDSSQGVSNEAAVLQLEALHALLLLLPLPDSPPLLREHVVGTARGTEPGPAWQQGWAAAARRGAGWVLRSRVGAVQKHSALQLSAALVELLGPRWLVPDQATPVTHGGVQPKAGNVDAGEFVGVLAQTLHVELGLLLSDALHPSVKVAEDEDALPAKPQWQPPAPSDKLIQELRAKADDEEEGEEGDDAAQGQGHSQTDTQEQRNNAHTSMHPGQQARQSGAQGEAPMDVEAPTNGHAGGQSRPPPTSAPTPSSSFGAGMAPAAPAAATMTAGARAARRLPAVLLLVEALIEVLVEDAEGDEVKGNDHGHAGSDMPSQDLAMPLPAAIQQQLLDALTSVMEEMAQFLETAADAAGFWEACAQGWDCPLPQGGQHTATAADGTAGAKGAPSAGVGGARSQAGDAQGLGQGGAGGAPARVPRDSRGPHTSAAAVAASMAELALKPEAPDGEVVLGCVRVIGRFLADAPDAHTAALRKVVPFMVAAGSTGLGSSCGSEQCSPQAQGEEVSAIAMAIGFLLPGLLQALSSQSPGALDLREQLCASPPALHALVADLSDSATRAAAHAAAIQAAAAQPGAGGKLPVSAAVRVGEMVAAERRLADVAMLLTMVVDPQVAQAPQGDHHNVGGKAGGSSRGAQPAAAAASGVGGSALGPITRLMLSKAVTSLSAWACVRIPQSLGSGVAAAAAPAQVGTIDPLACMQAMAGVRLLPRTLLCAACLAGCVMDAAVHQLHHTATAAGGRKSSSAASPPPALGQLLSSHGAIQEEQVVAACELMAAGLRVGLCLSSGLVIQEAAEEGEPWAKAPARLLQPAAATGQRAGAEGSLPDTHLGLHELLSDVPGDCECCWERLAGAAASMYALLPPLQAALAGTSTHSQVVGDAGPHQQPHVAATKEEGAWWRRVAAVQQAAKARSGARAWDVALHEVAAQSMNLSLLLSACRAAEEV